MNEETPGLTEETLDNFTTRLAAGQRLSALKVFADRIRESSGGKEFLIAWAKDQRERGEAATSPAVSPEMSMVLGDLYRDALEETLRALDL